MKARLVTLLAIAGLLAAPVSLTGCDDDFWDEIEDVVEDIDIDIDDGDDCCYDDDWDCCGGDVWVDWWW